MLSSAGAVLLGSSNGIAATIHRMTITQVIEKTVDGVQGTFIQRDGGDKGTVWCQQGSYVLPGSDYVSATQQMKYWLDTNEWWGDRNKEFWSNDVCAFIRNGGGTQNFPGNAFQNDLSQITNTCGAMVAGFVAHDDWEVNYGVFDCAKEWPGDR